MIFVNKNIFV